MAHEPPPPESAVWRPVPARKPKLLERVHEASQRRLHSPLTERAYLQWIKRYIFFHHVRHPVEMGRSDVSRFLRHLAVEERVSASAQNQALNALLFLYHHVLGKPLAPDPGRIPR